MVYVPGLHIEEWAAFNSFRFSFLSENCDQIIKPVKHPIMRGTGSMQTRSWWEHHGNINVLRNVRIFLIALASDQSRTLNETFPKSSAVVVNVPIEDRGSKLTCFRKVKKITCFLDRSDSLANVPLRIWGRW
jgi:hypothetical protein